MSRIATSITMSMREVDRVKTVQAVIDRMLPPGGAAQRLGLSRRQLERLVLRYRARGATGLVSAKRGRPSNLKLELELTPFHGLLRAEVLRPLDLHGRRVVHRRRGGRHASADGGQPVFAARGW